MRIPKEARRARRKRAAEAWEEILDLAERKRTEGGRHPTAPELADLVHLHGVPTPRAEAYIEKRLRGEHNVDSGRPRLPTFQRWERLRKQHQLFVGVEQHAAAFRLQGVRAFKRRALERVAKLAGISDETLQGNLKEYRKAAKAENQPLPDQEAAEEALRRSLEAGAIELHLTDGWVKTAAVLEYEAFVRADIQEGERRRKERLKATKGGG